MCCVRLSVSCWEVIFLNWYPDGVVCFYFWSFLLFLWFTQSPVWFLRSAESARVRLQVVIWKNIDIFLSFSLQFWCCCSQNRVRSFRSFLRLFAFCVIRFDFTSAHRGELRPCFCLVSTRFWLRPNQHRADRGINSWREERQRRSEGAREDLASVPAA